MRIRFERTGGFANIPLRAEIDTANMPPERAQQLERLIENARPFDQPSQSSAAVVPDDLQYQVTFEDAERSQTINTSDSAAPDDLKLLFDFLGEEALNKLQRKS